MDTVIQILIFGISFGVVLFLASFAFSVSLGLMGVINASHGAIFMVGGFTGITVAEQTGNWLLGVLAGGITASLIALIIHLGFLQHLYKQALPQILVTFGWSFALANISLWIWGAMGRMVAKPASLTAILYISDVPFPVYRLGLTIIGIGIFFLFWWVQEKTRVGAIIRAGMDDAETLSALGVNLKPVAVGAFSLTLGLAGMAAVAASPVLGGISFGTWTYVLFMSIIIAIIGGVGSVQGTFVGALIVGVLWMWLATFFSELPTIGTYVVLIIILLFRPWGLFGRKP
jgi:branched-chain amino acid transport system permease protein